METRLGGFWTKEIRKLEVLMQTGISLFLNPDQIEACSEVSVCSPRNHGGPGIYGHGNIKYGIQGHTNASASLYSNPSLINHMMNPFPSFHKQEQLEKNER